MYPLSLFAMESLIRKKFPQVHTEVKVIINHFFGEEITVSGLITGQDLKEQLAGADLGDRLLLPCNMLREGENVFLDDVTVENVERELGIRIQVVDEPGKDLVCAVLNEKNEWTHKRRVMYEQSDSSNCGPSECGQIDPV